jgi:hypothetical protein
MTNLQPSSAANWVAKLIPTITTVCLTLGAVAIYDSQRNDSIQLTNEAGSNVALSPSSSSQIPGPQGPTGAQGEIGPQGPKGDPGATGATGPAGEKGDKGATGSQGVAGPAGPAGPQGATGPVGATGPTGPAGSSGTGGGSGIVVKDASGAIVENVVQIYFEQDGIVYVRSSDTLFRYVTIRGELVPMTQRNPMFLTPTCTGSYVWPFRELPNNSVRFMRQFPPNYWPVYVGPFFKVNQVEKIGAIYELQNDDACTRYQYNNNKYFELTEIVNPPRDLPGPFIYSFN